MLGCSLVGSSGVAGPDVGSMRAKLQGTSRDVSWGVDSNAIGQRRWALEWAVVFTGPYHDRPPEWEEVDLSV